MKVTDPPEKPKKENYGWHEQRGFDDEKSGWTLEGGEKAYDEAVKKYEKKILIPQNIKMEE